MRTSLPVVSWRSLVDWSDPEAKRRYDELIEKAEAAAKAAAEPYELAAGQLFATYARWKVPNPTLEPNPILADVPFKEQS